MDIYNATTNATLNFCDGMDMSCSDSTETYSLLNEYFVKYIKISIDQNKHSCFLIYDILFDERKNIS